MRSARISRGSVLAVVALLAANLVVALTKNARVARAEARSAPAYAEVWACDASPGGSAAKLAQAANSAVATNGARLAAVTSVAVSSPTGGPPTICHYGWFVR
jgi:hypothetical protein